MRWHDNDGRPTGPPSVIFGADGTVSELERLLIRLNRDHGSTGALVLAGAANAWTPLTLGPRQTEAFPIPICGGVFPAIIHDGKLVEKGTVVIGLGDPGLEVVTLPSLDRLKSFELPPLRTREETLFTVADGLAPGTQRFVEELQYRVGPLALVIGGGSGTGDLDGAPSVITPEGLLGNAGVVCRFRSASRVAVGHGWEMISDPIRVTSSAGTRVFSLNYSPAFHVYREYVENSTGVTGLEHRFSSIAPQYPVGLVRLGQEVIVRDPVRLNTDQSMVFVGEVPQGSFIRILQGDPDKLIAATSALRDEIDAAPSDPPRRGLLMLMNCISRRSFLGRRVHEEIMAVSRGEPLVGMLTVGEIAHPPDQRVEFLNKSSVVARISLEAS